MFLLGTFLVASSVKSLSIQNEDTLRLMTVEDRHSEETSVINRSDITLREY